MKIRAALTAALVAAASVAAMLSVPASAKISPFGGEVFNDSHMTLTIKPGSGASIMAEVDPDNGCYFWRVNPAEDYPMRDMYYDILDSLSNQYIYIRFSAKASKPTVIDPLFHIMDTLYLPDGYHANLSTEAQEFSYLINDAVGQEKDKPDSYGKTILEYLQAGGSAANDKQDAFMHNLQFNLVDKDFTGTIDIWDIRIGCVWRVTYESSVSNEFDPDGYFQQKFVLYDTADSAEGGAAPAASSAAAEVSSAAEEVSSEEVSSEEVSSEEVSSTAVSSTASEAEEGGLSTGAIVGIVIAVIVVIAGVCAGVYFSKKKGAAADDTDTKA